MIRKDVKKAKQHAYELSRELKRKGYSNSEIKMIVNGFARGYSTGFYDAVELGEEEIQKVYEESLK